MSHLPLFVGLILASQFIKSSTLIINIWMQVPFQSKKEMSIIALGGKEGLTPLFKCERSTQVKVVYYNLCNAD